MAEKGAGENMKNLLLTEHAWQVQDFLKKGVKGNWIAVGPSAASALQNYGISYEIPDNYVTPTHLARACLAQRKKLESFCDDVDKHLYASFPQFKRWGIRPFTFNLFSLFINSDGLVMRALMLQQLMNHFSDHVIWAHCCPLSPLGVLGLDLLFSNEETLWGALLKLPGWNCEKRLLQPSRKKPQMRQLSPAERVERLIGAKLMRLGLLTWRRFDYLRAKANHQNSSQVMFKRTGSLKTLLVNSSAGPWGECFEALRRDGWIVSEVKERMLKSQNELSAHAESLSKFLRFIQIKENENGYFTFGGKSFLSLFQQQFERIYRSAAPTSLNIIKFLQSMIRESNLRAVISANHPTFTSHALNQVARMLGVPVLKWQHGFVMACEDDSVSQFNDMNDLISSDVTLTFGRAVAEGYKRSKYASNTKIFAVGSCSLDRIRAAASKRDQDRRCQQGILRLLYVITNYYENNWYCGFSLPVSVMRYYHDQMAIADYLNKKATAGDLRVTIKLCPCLGFIDPPWMHRYAPFERLRYIHNKPKFADLLFDCDLVLIDSPTTTALEAVATTKPVFLLMSHVGYSKHARSLLEKRAVCANDTASLIAHIDTYISTGLFPAETENNEYLMAFGNHLDDGKSQLRALDVLNDTIADFKTGKALKNREFESAVI